VITAMLVVAGMASAGSSAQARPQITAGATTGVALTDLRAGNGPRVAYHLGARVDFLFARSGPREMALGPYLDVVTAGFDTFEGGGGVAWLVPTGSTAFVFSAGGFARTSRFGWEPGASTTLFWGSRSYNFHSAYAVSAGLFAQGRYGFGDGRQADAILGAQIDLEYLALPFVFLYQALAH
jgi:hypothetical protein